MSRSRIHIVPVVLNVISLIVLCLVIFAGFNNGLYQLYWLKTDNAEFKAPSKLSGSAQLSAIQEITHQNLVGESVTAASLGLPDWSGVNLLTECGKFSDGRVECSKPKLGFGFRPDKDLKLVATSLKGKVAEELIEAVEGYSKSNRFIQWAFIIAAFCGLGAPIESLLSPLLSSVTCGFATVMLAAASIAAAVVFKRLSDAINAELGPSGLKASTGVIPVVLGFVATACFFASAFGYVIAYRRGSGSQRNKRVSARSVGGKGGFQDEYPGAAANVAGGQKPGLWSRVAPGINDHKYVPIEGQGALAHNHGAGSDRDLEAPGSPSGMGRRLDDDWAAPDDFSSNNAGSGAAKTSSGPATIPMLPLSGNKGTKDLNTAYEPYKTT